MELHKLHGGENGSGFVLDGHAVARGDIGTGRLAIDLPKAARGEQNRVGAEFVQRAVRFVNEANADCLSIFDDKSGGESVSAKMKMRNGIGAGEKRAADLAAGRVAMRMQNARTAMSGFPREGQLRTGSVEFGAPFNELRDVFGTFFDKQRHRFGPAKAVACVNGVLLVEADLVFVAERDGDAALRPGRGGI